MVVRCQNCGADVRIDPWQQPVMYRVREADAFGPPSFFIIAAGGWHLHQCVIVNSDSNGPRREEP